MVEYGREFQARAADELALLPEGSAIAEMLADYGVMREHGTRTDTCMVGSCLAPLIIPSISPSAGF